MKIAMRSVVDNKRCESNTPPIITKGNYAFFPEALTLVELDQTAIDIIKSYKKFRGDLTSIINDLKKKYSEDDIKEVISEIKQFTVTSAPKLRKTKIKSIGIFLTGKCNMECTYCYLQNKEDNKDFNLECYLKTFEYFNKSDLLSKKINIFFTGGEPLLKFDLIRNIIKINKNFRNYEFTYSITTNGLLLDEEIVVFFIKNNGKIKISLDGEFDNLSQKRKIKNTNHTFDNLIANTKSLIEKYPDKISARMTVNLTNPSLNENLTYLKNIGFRKIYMTPETPPNKNLYKKGMYKKMLCELDYSIKKIISNKYFEELSIIEPMFSNIKRILTNNKSYFPCGAGRDYVVVDQSGKIYPCHRMVGIDALKMGKINNIILTPYFCNKNYLLNKKPCISCKAKFLCSGGCYFDNYMLSKKIHQINHITCEYAKGLFDITLKATIALLDMNKKELNLLLKK